MDADNVAEACCGSVRDAGSHRAVVYIVDTLVEVTCGTVRCVRARVRAAFHRGGPSLLLVDPA